MHSSEIRDVINLHQGTKLAFDGIYAIDTYRKTKLPLHRFAIINLSRAAETGSHWICVYRSSKDLLEVMDSLGTSASFVQTHLVSRNMTSAFNQERLQPLRSDKCAKYCLYFLIERLGNHDQDYHEAMQLMFSSDCAVNDQRVEEFMVYWTRNQRAA